MRMARDGRISLHLYCGRTEMHLKCNEYGDGENTISFPRRRKVCQAEQKLIKIIINKFKLEKVCDSMLELSFYY